MRALGAAQSGQNVVASIRLAGGCEGSHDFPFSGRSSTVGFGLAKSKIPYLSTGVDRLLSAKLPRYFVGDFFRHPAISCERVHRTVTPNPRVGLCVCKPPLPLQAGQPFLLKCAVAIRPNIRMGSAALPLPSNSR